jgi:hypothetical protein
MTKKKEIEPCCVADQFCLAPANFDPPVSAKGECFSCGEKVCTACSSIRKYYKYGKVRLCNKCQIEYDENDKRVVARLHKMAERK